MDLMDHQKKAIELMHNGCILHGGVGSGKSATALGYYELRENTRDIVVITTARKRDSLDWMSAANQFHVFPERELSKYGTITVDSWNNIGKYLEVQDAFFIFDEQRVVGRGTWVKSFLKIAKQNHWILLSATPGDTWMDYVPVFVANGYFKNRTEFERKHVLWEPFIKFPKVKGYLNETKLELLRNHILVEMPYEMHTERVLNWIPVNCDMDEIKAIWRTRWNTEEDRPIKDVAELFRIVRKVSNTDPSRLEFIRTLLVSHDRLVVFYNFNYELDILRTLADEVNVLEWNGHKKDNLPDNGEWIYLVQYVAGAEAWNCTSCNAMVFYSLTYSYKTFEQAQGRIDRIDTPYTTLYYYVLLSHSKVDLAIKDALSSKKDFNERKMLQMSLLHETPEQFLAWAVPRGV